MRDESGSVWAIPNGWPTGAIYRQQARGWQEETLPDEAGFTAHTLTRGDDGSVYVFWQTQNETPPRNLVTIHRGLSSRVLARFSDPVFKPSAGNGSFLLWAGVGGDVWLEGSFPALYHVTKGGIVTAFPFKPEQFDGGRLPGDNPQAQTSSVVDGAGRRWFWQGWTYFWSQGGLRGFLIWDGKTLAYHDTLPGFPRSPASQSFHPEDPFQMLAPLDTHHLWLSVLGGAWQGATRGGLYRLDTDTLSSAREVPPEKGAFQNVRQVFRANGDWYVVEKPTQNDQPSFLWRSAGGHWIKCVPRLEDPGGDYSIEAGYPWQAKPAGVWLVVKIGAWWIPKDRTAPIWVDWRRGINVGAGLFPLPASPPPLLPPRLGVVTGGLGASKGIALLVTDPRHHLWGLNLYNTATPSLDEWDGKRWWKRRLPKGLAGVNGLYACDSLGRLWLATMNWNPPAQPQPVEAYTVYDPAHDHWTSYAAKQDALQQAAAQPGMAFLPRDDPYQTPLFSRDGRVTYLNNASVFLYDGHVWRHWEAHDVKPGYSYAGFGSSPEFNADGNLQVQIQDEEWECTRTSVWQPTGRPPIVKPQPPLPPGGPKGVWGPLRMGEGGADWVAVDGDVYETRSGLWAKEVALSGRGSPFWDGRYVEAVLADPVGRLFFVTRPGGYCEFVVWMPPPAPPAPRIRVTPCATDSIAFHFLPASRSAQWFLWRLNGGEWSAPQRGNTVTLEDLSPGPYRVEVQAMDAQLQVSAHPSSAAFMIRPATPDQVGRWVQTLLSGSDDAREAAARGLRKQPDLALPALRAARPGASEQGRWWIDAVLQQLKPDP